MKTSKLGLVLAAAGCLAFLSACPPPPRGAVFVRVGPPSARVEVVGVAPGPDHVWIRGHYSWDGAAYAWAPGHWEPRPRARAVWVEGHWAHHRNGWYWVEGRWK